MMSLIRWGLAFLAVAAIAAVFGYSRIAPAAAGIARIFFFVFLTLFVVMMLIDVAGAVASL